MRSEPGRSGEQWKQRVSPIERRWWLVPEGGGRGEKRAGAGFVLERQATGLDELGKGCAQLNHFLQLVHHPLPRARLLWCWGRGEHVALPHSLSTWLHDFL